MGPADLRDQRWLDDRIAAIEDGVQSVVDIAHNWTDGRNLSRLHPGVSAAEYVTSKVGVLGKSVVPVLLSESNWSNRQIAAVAGVDEGTVRNVVKRSTAEDSAVERPAATLGADGKLRPGRVVRHVVAEIIEEAAAEADTPVAVSEEEPIETPSPVSPGWPVLLDVMSAVQAIASADAAQLAATVPNRRRAATARRLRDLGTSLGRIALFLERMEGQK